MQNQDEEKKWGKNEEKSEEKWSTILQFKYKDKTKKSFMSGTKLQQEDIKLQFF